MFGFHAIQVQKNPLLLHLFLYWVGINCNNTKDLDSLQKELSLSFIFHTPDVCSFHRMKSVQSRKCFSIFL